MEIPNSRAALGDLSNLHRSHSMNESSKTPLSNKSQIQKTPLFQNPGIPSQNENAGATGKTSKPKSLFESNLVSEEKKFGSTIELTEPIVRKELENFQNQITKLTQATAKGNKRMNFLDFIEHLDIILEDDDEQCKSQQISDLELEVGPISILQVDGTKRMTFQPIPEEFANY